MKRFYDRSIKALIEDLKLREMAADIESYVNHLEHERGIYLAEIDRVSDGRSNLVPYRPKNVCPKCKEEGE